MTQRPTHPRDPEAAEYVLGTLPAEERRAFARAMETDPGLRAAVQDWERRLLPLADEVEPVTPPDALWRDILASIEPAAATPAQAEILPFPASAELARLRRARTLWRGVAGAASALAAGLALFIAVDRMRLAAPETSLVAVVNRSGELPALIVKVDSRAGTVQVRALGAAPPPGRSLELWSIVGSEAPRSLGLVSQGALRVGIAEGDRPRLDGATIAVTAEQPGGSPDGRPHGPVVYSGKLVPENP